METVRDFIFLGSKITADGDCSHEIKRRLVLGRKSYDKPRQHIKKQRHYFADKNPCSQSYGFSSGHVWVWELDHKEGWALKNWCFWTLVLDKTLESPLDCKEIQPVHPKGDQSWIFIGRIDAEGEAPILWAPDVKSRLIRKDPDPGKDGRWKEKGMTEDEMVRWHHWLNRHEFEQVPAVVKDRKTCCPAVHGVTKSWTQLSDRTTTTIILLQSLKERKNLEKCPFLVHLSCWTTWNDLHSSWNSSCFLAFCLCLRHSLNLKGMLLFPSYR